MLLSVREIINTPGKKISFQFSMDLSCVEFGGGVMESFDLIAPAMYESYKKNVYFYANEGLEIEANQ